MARVAQGGANPGQPLVGGRWQHPNAVPRPKDPRWTQDKRWAHVAGGGPKIDTVALEEAAKAKREAPVERKRDDLLPRDKVQHYGKNAGRRNMRRRKHANWKDRGGAKLGDGDGASPDAD